MNRLPVRRSTAGFTLTEVIIVIVLVGVLMAILAPGWVTFMNSRRADAARDQILQALRLTQAQAIRTKQAQTIQFRDRTDNSPPTITVLGQVQNLGNNQGLDQFNPKMISLQVQNGAVDDENRCPDVNCIAFDSKGNVLNRIADPGIKIVVSAPPNNGKKRCLFVATLLGEILPRSDSDCN
jgi:prepilin-type N-terminal cleavage/methylation domain-containing protein